MATADQIASAAAADRRSPTVDLDRAPHILAGVYANLAPERDTAPPAPPVAEWASNRALEDWEQPIIESAIQQERERERALLRGVLAGES